VVFFKFVLLVYLKAGGYKLFSFFSIRLGVSFGVEFFLKADSLLLVRFSNGFCVWMADAEEMFLF
jgi:hypothetical protein